MIDYKNVDKAVEKKKKNVNWLKITGISLFFALIIFIFSASAYFYVGYSKKHNVLKYVAVAGNNILTSKYIRNITQTDKSRYMDSCRVKNIYSKLILNPWVKKAYVAKLYPDTIYIKIIEKKPKSVFQTNKNMYLIAENGKVIDKYEKGLNVNVNLLPLIVAKNPKYIEDHYLLASVIKMYNKLDKFNKISYIKILSEGYQLVHFSNSLNVAVNSLNCPHEAFEHLRKEWSNLVSKKDKLDSVSICFSNKFVLRWKKEKKGVGN